MNGERACIVLQFFRSTNLNSHTEYIECRIQPDRKKSFSLIPCRMSPHSIFHFSLPLDRTMREGIYRTGEHKCTSHSLG